MTPIRLPTLDNWADVTVLTEAIQSIYNDAADIEKTVQTNAQQTEEGLSKLSASVALIPAQCAYTSPTFALTASNLPTTGSCTVRFIAPSAYTKGNTLKINGTAYTLTMTNGKALGDNAWVSGAVVNLQLDPANKKAFFSAGGADLSFVTAAAEHIMQGYIGADADGEPVAGTRTMQVWTGEASNLTWPSDQGYTPIVTFPMPPDFEPDVILYFAYVGNSGDPDTNITGTYYINLMYGVIDFVYQTGLIEDGAGGKIYTSQDTFYSSRMTVKAWSECPISPSAASFAVQKTSGGGYAYSTNIMVSSRIVAFKF